jgi:hypothetical protein
MELIDIPLDRLERHPMNSNVMPGELMAKLTDHIGRTDRYPPVIVREIAPGAPATRSGAQSSDDSAVSPALCRPRNGQGGQEQRYQILDGHHRVEALRRLKRTSARCVVWEVTDDEALLLLATLNRLQGRDDPHRRAALVAELAGLRRVDARELAEVLPERAEELASLLSLRAAPPALRGPRALGEMPVCVHFFLKPAQRDALEGALRAMGGPREAALMRLVDLARSQ